MLGEKERKLLAEYWTLCAKIDEVDSMLTQYWTDDTEMIGSSCSVTKQLAAMNDYRNALEERMAQGGLGEFLIS